MPHQSELYVGIMSGTSLDGVDVALVDLSENAPNQLGKHFCPFEDKLKTALLALHLPSHDELHHSQIIGNQLAIMYAEAVNYLLQQTGLTKDRISAIGCHGQTIRHRPSYGYTIQIGNAALLAELTGITVVSDFRSSDIAAGGQGAPLVPTFHDKLFRHPDIHRVIVNIGGISNITNLAPNIATSGFDCGPGNLLMDAWCMRHKTKHYDENGCWAASGNILPNLLEQMLNEPFFASAPPKSSGRDFFNITWLENKLQGTERPQDVQATLLELTCQTIAQNIKRYCPGANEIYLCGGGAHNKPLHTRLETLLADCTIRTTDDIGIDGDYLEAVAFAWLSQQTLLNKPANLPLVTGARHPCILGAIHRAYNA